MAFSELPKALLHEHLDGGLRPATLLDLHFEVCPSSNVHTGAFPSLATHPIRAMVDAGLSVSCSTDNRLMSGVTLSSELAALRAIQHWGELSAPAA